jgi:hypothetical protein
MGTTLENLCLTMRSEAQRTTVTVSPRDGP